MYALLLAVIYLAFVSLGLPDSLLGSAWPSLHVEFGVPSSYAGFVSMAIAGMTIVSSLVAPKLMNKVHTKWIVAVSILLTVIGLLGFSFSSEYWMLFIFAVPYGLGAGCIDAALNSYVAMHYSSRVMNFLHCFYGVGAVISPNIMGLALSYAHWNEGYRWTAYIQLGILLIVILSFPLWRRSEQNETKEGGSAGILETLRTPGVFFCLVAFFAYCGGEATAFLWTSSYFSSTYQGMDENLVASFGSLVFGGLMLGRLLSGLVSNRLGDRLLIRIGIGIETIGIVMVAIPSSSYVLPAIGFVLVGLGMGPIYPSIQHMAPSNFGNRLAPTVIGLQMASAYVGSTFMPTVFGLLQESVGIWTMPIYLGCFLILNIGMLEIGYLVMRHNKKKQPEAVDSCVSSSLPGVVTEEDQEGEDE